MGDLQHDPLNPQDIAKGNDHDADRHRYASMTRQVGIENAADKPINYDSPSRQPSPQQLLEMITSKSRKSPYVTKR